MVVVAVSPMVPPAQEVIHPLEMTQRFPEVMEWPVLVLKEVMVEMVQMAVLVVLVGMQLPVRMDLPPVVVVAVVLTGMQPVVPEQMVK